ncbi:hypothetical protein GIB67_007565 [Kingdonia uniflora]|uniref:Small auxin up regulated protein n=1 Tax=Kingdonia uniflora TaxID=39325 RepID=A0A7J7LNM8_9MAGN|nr:hypothetical protein GIB67_007565 [Kingdonia uniflora]
MGIQLQVVSHAKQILQRSLFAPGVAANIPNGHFAVYIGESRKKRFVIPISYLNHPSFPDLLSQAEEEFGFYHPMGALTIPCNEVTFINLTCNLNKK